jgi:hypothetical protein
MKRFVCTVLLALCLPLQGQELGKYLYAHGYHVTTWRVSSSRGWVPAYGHFDPSSLDPGLPGCFLGGSCIKAYNGRYGGPGLTPWGYGEGVGERFSQEGLEAFFGKVGLPLPATALDRQDALLVLGAWDSLISPAAAGAVTPPVSPPVPPKPATPPVPPVAPAIPDCRDGGPDGARPLAVVTQVSGWYYRPGTQSTGRLNLELVTGPECRVKP